MIMMSTYAHEELYSGLKLRPGTELLNNLRTELLADLLTFYRDNIYITVTVAVNTLVSALAGYACRTTSSRRPDRSGWAGRNHHRRQEGA